MKLPSKVLLIAVVGILFGSNETALAHGRRPPVSVSIDWHWAWWPSWVWSVAGWYPPPAVLYRGPVGALGALDVDISPDRAEVWVDGELVGVADDFDGFPTYLWLTPGTYDVVFYLPNYRTLARQYTIRPGQVIDVEDQLERGESIHPGDLVSRSTERRDERLRRREERYREYLRELERELESLRRELETLRREKLKSRGAQDEHGSQRQEEERLRGLMQELEQELETQRRNLHELQEERLEQQLPAERDHSARAEEDLQRTVGELSSTPTELKKEEQAKSGSARVRLIIEPGDASVYLDGRLLGSAAELSRLRDGLLVASGEHLLEVVRPGRQDYVQRFHAQPGSEVALEITLRYR